MNEKYIGKLGGSYESDRNCTQDRWTWPDRHSQRDKTVTPHSQGESMEILVSSDGEIILTKNSPAQGIEPLAGEYVEALAELTRATACVCDRYQVIAAAGPQSGNCLYQRIHEDLQQCIEQRQVVMATAEDARFCRLFEKEDDVTAQVICPIVSEGDAIGALFLFGKKEGMYFTETEEKMAHCGARFLARQTEG